MRLRTHGHDTFWRLSSLFADSRYDQGAYDRTLDGVDDPERDRGYLAHVMRCRSNTGEAMGVRGATVCPAPAYASGHPSPPIGPPDGNSQQSTDRCIHNKGGHCILPYMYRAKSIHREDDGNHLNIECTMQLGPNRKTILSSISYSPLE